jgi:hypothetical protein
MSVVLTDDVQVFLGLHEGALAAGRPLHVAAVPMDRLLFM